MGRRTGRQREESGPKARSPAPAIPQEGPQRPGRKSEGRTETTSSPSPTRRPCCRSSAAEAPSRSPPPAASSAPSPARICGGRTGLSSTLRLDMFLFVFSFAYFLTHSHTIRMDVRCSSKLKYRRTHCMLITSNYLSQIHLYNSIS